MSDTAPASRRDEAERLIDKLVVDHFTAATDRTPANARELQQTRAALLALVSEHQPAPPKFDMAELLWKDAASAPKTGEHILITQLGEGGFGGNPRQDWCAVVHYWPVEGEEGFYLSSGLSHAADVEDFDDRPMRFTHWRPLPDSDGGFAAALERAFRINEAFARRGVAQAGFDGLAMMAIESVRAPGACNCFAKTPSVPVYRDHMTHLGDCPARHSGTPVGQFSFTLRGA